MSNNKEWEPKLITINLLVGDMASGKTEAVINYIETYPEEMILFMSPSHKTLFEIGDRLDKIGIKNVHWEGFERLCPEFLSLNPDIQILYHSKFLVKQICTYCTKKGWMLPKHCSYNRQFKSKVRVIIAPLSFLNTSVVQTPPIHRVWNHVFVDDVNIRITRELPSRTNINRFWQESDFFNLFQKNPSNFEDLKDLEPKEFLFQIKEVQKQSHILYKSILEYGDLTQWVNIPQVINPPIFEFKRWMFYLQKYERLLIQKYAHLTEEFVKKECISYYYLFHLFKLAREPITPRVKGERLEFPPPQITIVGKQTPARIDSLQQVAKRYKREEEIHITFNEIEPPEWLDAPEKGPLIRICPEGRYSRESFLEHPLTRKRVAKEIVKAINKLFKGRLQEFQSIGVITTLVLMKEGESWLMKEFFSDDIYSKNLPLQILTFGDFMSSNKFIDVSVVIILGSYNVDHKALLEEYNRISTDKKLDSKTIHTTKDGLKGYIFKDHQKLETMRQYYEDDEMTQAIGRGVPRGIPTIVVGEVPDYYKQECVDVYEEWTFKPKEELVEGWEDILEQEFKKQGITEMKASDCKRIIEKQTDYKFAKQNQYFYTLIRDLFQKFKLMKRSEGKRGPPSYYLVQRL